MTKTVTANGYQGTGGLERDSQDRIIVVEPTRPIVKAHIVEANSAGIARIEKIVKSSSEKFEERALQQVQDHFIANPNTIPSPNSVRGDLLLSVEGFGS